MTWQKAPSSCRERGRDTFLLIGSFVAVHTEVEEDLSLSLFLFLSSSPNDWKANLPKVLASAAACGKKSLQKNSIVKSKVRALNSIYVERKVEE